MELVRGGVNRVRLMTPVHKQSLNPTRRALIIGGGVAGMTAALSIADSGFDVTLVERSAELGGNLRHVYYVAEGQNPQRLLRDLVNRVRGHERITVLTRSRVIEHNGSVGQFRSVIHSRSGGNSRRRMHEQPLPRPFDPDADARVVRTSSVAHGVTIVATGGRRMAGRCLLA